MKRRTFLSTSLKGGIALAGSSWLLQACGQLPDGSPTTKNWVWITPEPDTSDQEWRRRFRQMKKAGIDAILPEIKTLSAVHYQSKLMPVASDWLGQLIPLAHKEGLEVHAWMVSMPNTVPEIIAQHPDWYLVNGNGDSCLEKPAYVDYYKFLCSAREPVQEFMRGIVGEIAQYDVDGVHFDYIRMPDVIIAKGLWEKYNIVQDREYPEYDYCYCEECRRQFKEKHGMDPMEFEDPSQSAEWRQFRYDLVTNLVNNHMIPEAKKYGKQVSAAVFPNWEAVRQQWHHWKLDAALPMLYHSFYLEDINWIGEQCAKNKAMLQHDSSLYSGLFLPALEAPAQLAEATRVSLEGGAAGISLFSLRSMTDAHWEALGEVLSS